MSVLFPVLSKVQNDLPRFQNIIIKSLGALCFVVFMIVGVMFLISEELIIILFSEKWSLSSEYFKILIISGFGFPISALLVNILSSRGNSKAFLLLEICKKIIFGVNLSLVFIWGIEGYLYGLIIASVLAVLLNIRFASIEIEIEIIVLIKPIITQMIIASTVVAIVTQLSAKLDYGNLSMLFFKSLVFIVLYLLLSILFKTSAYVHFSDQIIPIIKNKIKKDKHNEG